MMLALYFTLLYFTLAIVSACEIQLAFLSLLGEISLPFPPLSNTSPLQNLVGFQKNSPRT